MEGKTLQTSVSLVGARPALIDAAAAAVGKPNNSSSIPPAVGAKSGDVVRRVTISEYKQAALCLAEAFKDDEVAQYFTHTSDREHWTEAQRWALHVEIMEYITYAHILKGLVLAIGPDYGCVALWMPPGENMDDYLTILRSGLWRLNYKLSSEGRSRLFDEFFPLLHDTKHEIMGPRDNDSWYLVYIGTKASARGKGYARKLIEYVTCMADFEGRACYLESSNAVNPVIYRKLGFEIVKTIVLAGGSKHPLDIMVREPVSCSRKPSPGLPPVLEKADSMFAEDAAQLSVAAKFGGGKLAHAQVNIL